MLLSDNIKQDPQQKSKSVQNNVMVKQMINDILNDVIAFGESIKLSKNLQKKYQSREVSKDIIMKKELKSYEVLNIIESSMNISNQTSRVMYVTKNNQLEQKEIHQPTLQYDRKIGNLHSVDISSKMPVLDNNIQIIDTVFDQSG